MIVIEQKRNAEVSEPLERAAYHIDDGAMGHIMGIMTRMYSMPELAAVREYCNNAIDAHVAAGVKEPIVVHLPTAFDPVFRVRDFGGGLSVEDTKRLLGGYGSSGDHKRTSNDQIGGFGIGAKVGFAVSQSFSYVIYHGGMKRVWACYLDDHDRGQQALQHEEPSDERAGIEVLIPTKPGHERAYNDAAQKVFKYYAIPPKVEKHLDGFKIEPVERAVASKQVTLEVDGSPFTVTVELTADKHTRNTRELDDWLGQTWRHGVTLVTGGSEYAADPAQYLTGTGSSFLYKPVRILAPIGLVQLAPNREQLQYSNRTKKVLSAIDAAFAGAEAWQGMLLPKTAPLVDRLANAIAVGTVMKRTLAGRGPSVMPLIIKSSGVSNEGLLAHDALNTGALSLDYYCVSAQYREADKVWAPEMVRGGRYGMTSVTGVPVPLTGLGRAVVVGNETYGTSDVSARNFIAGWIAENKPIETIPVQFYFTKVITGSHKMVQAGVVEFVDAAKAALLVVKGAADATTVTPANTWTIAKTSSYRRGSSRGSSARVHQKGDGCKCFTYKQGQSFSRTGNRGAWEPVMAKDVNYDSLYLVIHEFLPMDPKGVMYAPDAASQLMRVLTSNEMQKFMPHTLYAVRASDASSVKARGAMRSVWVALKEAFDKAKSEDPEWELAVTTRLETRTASDSSASELFSFLEWATSKPELETLAWIPEARGIVSAVKRGEKSLAARLAAEIIVAGRRVNPAAGPGSEESLVAYTSTPVEEEFEGIDRIMYRSRYDGVSDTDGEVKTLLRAIAVAHPLLPGFFRGDGMGVCMPPEMSRVRGAQGPMACWFEDKKKWTDFKTGVGTEYVLEYLTAMKPRELKENNKKKGSGK